MAKGKAVGIISIKGGVGKTTTVINLANVLANNFGKKVAVVDANFSSPNISLHLGNINHKKTMHDVLSGKSKLHDATYEHEFGFHIIPASIQKKSTGNGTFQKRFKQKINQLKNHYDVVLLDSSPSLNDEILSTIISSDELYVVSTPDVPTLSTTLKATKLAKKKKMKVHGLILNKVRGKSHELKPQDMERLSGVPLVGTIKDNVKVLEALSKVQPVTNLSPNSNVAREYKKIAAKITGTNYKEPKWHKKILAYLKDDFKNLTTHHYSKGLHYYK